MFKQLQRGLFLFSLLFSCLVTFAQERKLSGSILSKDNSEALKGATISIKGTNRVTTTDDAGRFSIGVSDESVLKVSMVGYEYQEIPVGKQTEITISLDKENKQMDEVVIVGYGSQKRTHLTGS